MLSQLHLCTIIICMIYMTLLPWYKCTDIVTMINDISNLLFFVTVRSFVELVQFIFTMPDVKVFLSNKLCQDPLEKFFGQQRQRGRANENPNAKDFVKNTQALRVVHGVCSNVKGNCRASNTEELSSDDTGPLPKRKYRKSKSN